MSQTGASRGELMVQCEGSSLVVTGADSFCSWLPPSSGNAIYSSGAPGWLAVVYYWLLDTTLSGSVAFLGSRGGPVIPIRNPPLFSGFRVDTIPYIPVGSLPFSTNIEGIRLCLQRPVAMVGPTGFQIGPCRFRLDGCRCHTASLMRGSDCGYIRS